MSTNILSGSITKGLLLMSFPIMVMQVCQSLFNVIDMAILGNLVGDHAVGAVGACSVLIDLTIGLLIGLSLGANVIIAKHIGSQNRQDAERAEGTTILLGLVGGVALMIVGCIFAGDFLKLSNCPDSLLDDATLYLRLYFIGVPPLMLYNFSAAVLRSVGDTRRPMYYLLLAGAIKVVLTYAFVLAFETTVEGVGAATIISNLIAGLLTFRAVRKNKQSITFSFKNVRFFGKELKPILYIGVPAGLQRAFYSVANLVIVAVVNKAGPDATTGISIANQFDAVIYQIVTAIPFAVATYVAQNAGAKNLQRVKQIIFKSILLTALIGGTFGGLSAIFSGNLASLMTNSPEVIGYAQQKMIIISSTYFITAINEIMGATMRGLGKPIVPTVATLLYMCLFRFVWVYLIYPFFPQSFTFLYLVWPIGWILCIITILVFLIPTMKKLKREFAKPVIQETEEKELCRS